MRKSANKVRISAQLLSVREDKQIWSKRWDRSLEDIFEVQDEVSMDVAGLISPVLKGQEHIKLVSKSKRNFSAWDEYLQGLSLYNKGDFVTLSGQILFHIKKSIRLDANFCDVYVLYCNLLENLIHSHEHQNSRTENERLFHQMSQKAVDIDPENPDAVSALSLSFNIKKDFDRRFEFAEKALQLNPNHPRANFSYGKALANFGKFEECLEYVQKAIKLDPFSKVSYEVFLPVIYVALRNWDNALYWIETFEARTSHSRYFGWKAAVLAHLGKIDLARSSLKKFLRERLEIKTLSDYEKVAPQIMKEALLEGLKVAGLPE